MITLIRRVSLLLFTSQATGRKHPRSEVDTRPAFFCCALHVTHTNISQLQWLKGKIKYLEMIPPGTQ